MEFVVFAVFACLAVGHSAMGETGVVRPLLADEDWTIPDIPRQGANRLVRWAWHLTSISWAGFAAVALGADAMMTVGLVGLASGVVFFIRVREHFAWSLFLVGSAAALIQAEVLTEAGLRVGALAAAAVLVGAALLHVYWAATGPADMEGFGPAPADGQPAFQPGPMLTLAVAVALGVMATLVTLRAFNTGPRIIHWLTLAGTIVLALRAVGDGRQVGFTKTNRSTRFAQNDDRIFTPLVTLLALGAAAALFI